MASKHLQEVVGRAVLDQAFRKALFEAPRATCEGAGLPLSPEEYEALANLDAEKLKLAAADLQGMGGLAG
jgi:hypothetical protein